MKVFKEQQRFTQSWVIIVLALSAIVSILIIFGKYLQNPNSFTIQELTTTTGVTLIATGLIFIFKLNTRIDDIGVHYQFFPFHFKLKTISWNDINNAYVRNYDAISEYGGWGLKGGWFWKKSKGTAINVFGDIGIQLELKNGKKLLIGTQKENEAKAVLETYKSKLQQEN